MPAAASRLMQVGLTISLTAFLSWLTCPKIGCCGFMPTCSERWLWPEIPSPSDVRQHRNREDFLNARDAYLARFPPDLADWPFEDRRLWLEATWEHIFDDALWQEGGFDQLGNDDGCPPVYGVTPEIWLHVDVIGCDDQGSVMWREDGDAHHLRLGARTVHLDASGLRAITDTEVEEDSNQLVYACVRGEARVEPQGGES